jgi:hypothetical protein
MSEGPKTPQEWQEAVDAAQFYLTADSCKQYGLLLGGPTVNGTRCAEILARGKKMGITPAPMEELCKRFIG